MTVNVSPLGMGLVNSLKTRDSTAPGDMGPGPADAASPATAAAEAADTPALDTVESGLATRLDDLESMIREFEGLSKERYPRGAWSGTLERVEKLARHTDDCRYLSWSRTGDYIVSSGDEGEMLLWSGKMNILKCSWLICGSTCVTLVLEGSGGLELSGGDEWPRRKLLAWLQIFPVLTNGCFEWVRCSVKDDE